MQVAAGTHPDLEVVSKPPDKSAIPVALLIGDKEHRMHEGLCHKIALKPFLGGRKVAIIDDADDLNQEGANCLLKTLEEPPPRSVLILIGTSADRQLPTIRSRAQLVRFQPLAEEIVAQLLLERKIVSNPSEARRLAAHSGGSVRRAAELADSDLWTFRRDFLQAWLPNRLRACRWPSKSPSSSKPPARRPHRAARMRLAAGFAVEFFRALVRRLNGSADGADAELAALVARAESSGWSEPAAVAAVERSLEALSQIDRNANQSILTESWLDDLAGAGTAESRQ